MSDTYSESEAKVWSMKSMLPLPLQGSEPMEVLIGIYLYDFFKVDDSQQTFEADFYLSFRWVDPNLAQVTENTDDLIKLQSRKVNLDEIWHPMIFILNRRQNLIQTFESVVVATDGTVVVGKRFQGSLSSVMDLKRFPFDQQVFPIQVSSYVYGPDEISLVVDEQVTGRTESLSIPNQKIESFSSVISSRRTSHPWKNYVNFTYQIPAKRHPTYYLGKVILPLMLINLMAYLVYWLNVEQTMPQVAISVATVLSLITYWFTLQQELPRIPYLTALDTFMIGSMLLVFAAPIETVITVNFAEVKLNLLAFELDQWMRWLMPMLYLGLTIVAFC